MAHKIAFIGAGSFGFTRSLVRDLLSFPAFHDATISLMDINAERLAAIKRAVERIVAEGKYAVIYITEALAAQLEYELDHYRQQPLPAVIPIPGITGNTGMGMRMVRKSVEQAVGSDIIFNEND